MFKSYRRCGLLSSSINDFFLVKVFVVHLMQQTQPKDSHDDSELPPLKLLTFPNIKFAKCDKRNDDGLVNNNDSSMMKKVESANKT